MSGRPPTSRSAEDRRNAPCLSTIRPAPTPSAPACAPSPAPVVACLTARRALWPATATATSSTSPVPTPCGRSTPASISTRGRPSLTRVVHGRWSSRSVPAAGRRYSPTPPSTRMSITWPSRCGRPPSPRSCAARRSGICATCGSPPPTLPSCWPRLCRWARSTRCGSSSPTRGASPAIASGAWSMSPSPTASPGCCAPAAYGGSPPIGRTTPGRCATFSRRSPSRLREPRRPSRPRGGTGPAQRTSTSGTTTPGSAPTWELEAPWKGVPATDRIPGPRRACAVAGRSASPVG